MVYKGYKGTFSYNRATGKFHGRVRDIKENLEFEGKTIFEVEAAMRSSVDSYLTLCSQEGRTPDNPFRSKFDD